MLIRYASFSFAGPRLYGVLYPVTPRGSRKGVLVPISISNFSVCRYAARAACSCTVRISVVMARFDAAGAGFEFKSVRESPLLKTGKES